MSTPMMTLCDAATDTGGHADASTVTYPVAVYGGSAIGRTLTLVIMVGWDLGAAAGPTMVRSDRGGLP